MKEPLVEEKYQNNENEINTQNEDINYMDIYLVKDKDQKIPSEETEDAKKGKNKFHNNQNHNIIFKYSLQYHNIGFILILAVLKTILLQGIPIFQ